VFAEPKGWRVGARGNCPDDVCPHCGATCCYFASDFKKMGQQSVRVCLACKSVCHNGERKCDFEYFFGPA
jgi:hypothetical protein